MADATIAEVRDYFGLTSGEMTREWRQLTAADKAAIKSGIGNGSFTY